MNNSKYKTILEFLQKYGGNQYKMLKKCNPGEELQYMENGSNSGKDARQLFTELIELIVQKFGLTKGKITQWQNSGTFVITSAVKYRN